ncbi:MAG TPA: phenylalanine--tRNA ligase beta subunit-related protein [Candidatus Dormibacteraeota bacterium]
MSRLALAVEAGVEVVALELRELEVTEPRADFTPVVADAVAVARAGRVGDTKPARALYRRFGIDPTKTRPSSEALLRRAVRGDPFPRINSLVDVANVMSLLAQAPVGLYDLDRVEGPLTLRVGAAGEGYEGIRKDHVSVAGRLCVADAFGPCGNPSSDSARTMITTATEHAAWIWFLPVGRQVLARTAELVAQYGRGLMTIP